MAIVERVAKYKLAKILSPEGQVLNHQFPWENGSNPLLTLGAAENGLCIDIGYFPLTPGCNGLGEPRR